MPRITTAVANAAIAAAIVPATTYYLSLHSADPGTTGATEFTGGGYVRQSIVFSTASGGVVTSNTAQAIPNAGSTAATYGGIWTASTAGTYLGGFALTGSVTAASITFASGAVTFTAA